MPRRKRIIKRRPIIDVRFNDFEVGKFVNSLMLSGRKSAAYHAFYAALDLIQERAGRDPLAVFKKALGNVRPKLEVRPRRVGGATYQIPIEVPSARSLALAIRWLIGSARARKGKPMSERLTEEFIEAEKGEGPSVKKKEETHKMAESNRAFAHYRW
jgi:small subunit ribosomal protein S7